MINVTNDTPIQDPSQDSLNRYSLAQATAEYISKKFKEFKKSKKDPKNSLLTGYNIAIIGTWGEGKTSFINLIKHELKINNDNDIEIKEFDPWYFPDKCDLHEQFLSLISNKNSLLCYLKGYFILLIIVAVVINSPFVFCLEFLVNNKLFDWIHKFFNTFIKLIEYSYLYFVIITIFYFFYNRKSLPSIPLLSSIFDFIGLFKEDEFNSVTFKDKLEKLVKKKKLLIVVDNIDRLHPIQIKRIFDLIKGIGNLPNVIYILAFDKQVVSKALNKKDVEDGSKYLDKFIQYQVFLHTTYEEHVIKEITEAFPNQKVIYEAIQISSYITNIRELKKLINQVQQNYELLENSIIFEQLLLITAISIKNSVIYDLISKSKMILCSTSRKQDKEFLKELIELKKQIENLKPPSAFWDIVLTLFPIMNFKTEDTEDIVNHALFINNINKDRLKSIDDHLYFDIYFGTPFPDDLVLDKDFKFLTHVADDKDKLYKLLLDLLNGTTKEEKQKIPNRLRYPFKWLNNLTNIILEENKYIILEENKSNNNESEPLSFRKQVAIDNISNWFFSLARTTEEYLKNNSINSEDSFYFKKYISNMRTLFVKQEWVNNSDIFPIYVFLMIYFQEKSSKIQRLTAEKVCELREVIITNINSYNKNNKIFNLYYYEKIIKFASQSPEEHKQIVDIIKTEIQEDNVVLLKFVYYFITQGHDEYNIKPIEYYISYNEAIQRLEGIKQLKPELMKPEDIELFINTLSKYINKTNR